MNENPGRGQDELPRDPDGNELEDEDFDAEDLGAQDGESGLSIAFGDDAGEQVEDEPPLASPVRAALPIPEAAPAYDEEEEELAEAYEEEPRPGPFAPRGRFAAPGRRRVRPEPRQAPALDAEDGGRRAVPAAITVFRPESNSGSMIGLGVVGLCLLVGLALILKSFSYDPSLKQFLPLVVGSMLLCLGALAAYWTWGSFSLRYVIDRNALSIHWGAQRQIVPLINIERLIPASPEGEEPDVQGVDWPGHHVGRAQVGRLGEVLFYSGHRSMADVLYVQTATQTYAVSVPDPVSFAESIQTNQMRGPLFEQRQEVQRDGIAAQSFWLDPQARFLTLVLLGAFILVVGYVLNTYPGLAQSVPLRYPALGGLLRVTDKSELLDIPRSAAAFLGLNLLLAIVLHPWERMVSIVLLLAGIAIQVALLVAAIVAVA